MSFTGKADNPADSLLFFFFGNFFFDGHVLKFGGVEDLSAIQAFDVFCILFARNDAYSGVFASRGHGVMGRRYR